MKLMTVLGARPQFVKAATVSRAIKEWNERSDSNHLEEIIVHTGQHFDKDMSDVFFKQMSIPNPKYRLEVGGLPAGAMTGRMIEELEKLIVSVNPDILLVYGDTNTTLAGALSAIKLHIPIAHVEAGLRSFNIQMPEEINRILTDRISTWLFCPTETAVINLGKEGLTGNLTYRELHVEQVGDVMLDAMLYYKGLARPSEEISKLLGEYKEAYYLATVHRAENTDKIDRLSNIIEGLDEIAKESCVILPLHPRTRNILETHSIRPGHIKIISPVSYFDMICLIDKCQAVITDSGGLQKEAFFLEKPCITLRDETEWVELVDHGFNQLAGANRSNMLKAIENLGKGNLDFSLKLYGNGNASEKIVECLMSI